jgi:recombination protein RecA
MSSQTKNQSTLARPDGVPTGSLALDLALGSGGWPRGCIVEVYGPEGCGKTTLLLEAIATAQRQGGLGAFIDADHGTTARTAERVGVNLEAMPFHRTNCLEDACEKIEELVLGEAVDVIALDSIAALVPKEFANCSHDHFPPAKNEEHQHRIDHFLKALLGPLSRSRAVLLIANQVREKAGVFFGNPETTPWETTPLRNYASQRVQLLKTGTIKDRETTVGVEIKAKIVKNRLARPFMQGMFELHFATGICHESDLVHLGLEAGVLTKRGSQVYFDGVCLGNGTTAVVSHLQKDVALAARLRDGIIERRQD